MLWLAAILLLLIWAWPVVWFRAVRYNFHAEVTLQRREAPVGEPILLTVILRNASWLPVPFAELLFSLPDGLSASSVEVEPLIRRTTHLWAREEVEMTLPVYGTRRGVRPLRAGNCAAHINEGFGIRALFVNLEIDGELVILPDVFQVVASPSLSQTLGTLERLRWTQLDESMLRGIREYAYGDQFRHIAWRATALTGRWMTKQFSGSVDPQAVIVLNAQFVDPHWFGTRHSELDDLCARAVGVAVWLERRGFTLSVATNAVIARDPKRQWVGRQSAVGLRSLLGRVQPVTNGSFDELLDVVVRRGADHPLIVLSSFFTYTQRLKLSKMRSEGRDVRIVYGADPSPDSVFDADL